MWFFQWTLSVHGVPPQVCLPYLYLSSYSYQQILFFFLDIIGHGKSLVSRKILYKKKLSRTLDNGFLIYLVPKSLGGVSSLQKDTIDCVYLARLGLRRCVRTRTRAMFGRTCACKILSEKCVRCVRVRHVFRCAMCDHTFAHFLHQNGQKKLFFVLIKNCSRISYPVLEYPFLL